MNERPALHSPEHTQHLLQDLVMTCTGLDDFLQRLVEVASGALAEDPGQVMVGVTVLRQRAKAAITGTCPAAHTLTAIQYRFGDGPAVQAAAGETVEVADFLRSADFPLYGTAALQRGIRSALGVPVPLDGPTTAVLTYYAREPRAFPEETVHRAEQFTASAATPLGLTVRLAGLTDKTEQLAAAMESRTTIDLAAGVIMARRGCTQDEAIGLLRAASSSRNMRLRDLASNVLASTVEAPVSTHFD
ncbi:GAF and ANTAR domain-containing protein [Arthrobacter sp. Soc17.1.1.1]|uniref:GAF and ANTAR domain-containing protein n=1 Tax=Arthrobacter sp. Soc17.1.1.1 TaxID=3121277 RepID=UPI002FE4F664